MSELSPSGGSEGYGTCDDEVHKCALGIPAVTPFLHFQPPVSATPALPVSGKVTEETL